MKKYQEVTGKKIMMWDVGYIPKIYQIEFTFITIPLVDLRSWIRDIAVAYLRRQGYQVYSIGVAEYQAGPLKNYILTTEIGEKVVAAAALPPIILGFIALLATIGGIVIAWKLVDVWARREEVNLSRILLEEEVKYQQERLELLKSIQQLPTELRDEAIKILYTSPSLLYQPFARPTIFEELQDIIKLLVIGGVVLISAYGLTKLIVERRPAPAA
jgi:hypothetical protein